MPWITFIAVVLFVGALAAVGWRTVTHLKAQMGPPLSNRTCVIPRPKDVEIDTEETSKRIDSAQRAMNQAARSASNYRPC